MQSKLYASSTRECARPRGASDDIEKKCTSTGHRLRVSAAVAAPAGLHKKNTTQHRGTAREALKQNSHTCQTYTLTCHRQPFQTSLHTGPQLASRQNCTRKVPTRTAHIQNFESALHCEHGAQHAPVKPVQLSARCTRRSTAQLRRNVNHQSRCSQFLSFPFS